MLLKCILIQMTQSCPTTVDHNLADLKNEKFANQKGIPICQNVTWSPQTALISDEKMEVIADMSFEGYQKVSEPNLSPTANVKSFNLQE